MKNLKSLLQRVFSGKTFESALQILFYITLESLERRKVDERKNKCIDLSSLLYCSIHYYVLCTTLIFCHYFFLPGVVDLFSQTTLVPELFYLCECLHMLLCFQDKNSIFYMILRYLICVYCIEKFGN